jgi:hypothetical protein
MHRGGVEEAHFLLQVFVKQFVSSFHAQIFSETGSREAIPHFLTPLALCKFLSVGIMVMRKALLTTDLALQNCSQASGIVGNLQEEGFP